MSSEARSSSTAEESSDNADNNCNEGSFIIDATDLLCALDLHDQPPGLCSLPVELFNAVVYNLDRKTMTNLMQTSISVNIQVQLAFLPLQAAKAGIPISASYLHFMERESEAENIRTLIKLIVHGAHCSFQPDGKDFKFAEKLLTYAMQCADYIDEELLVSILMRNSVGQCIERIEEAQKVLVECIQQSWSRVAKYLLEDSVGPTLRIPAFASRPEPIQQRPLIVRSVEGFACGYYTIRCVRFAVDAESCGDFERYERLCSIAMSLCRFFTTDQLVTGVIQSQALYGPNWQRIRDKLAEVMNQCGRAFSGAEWYVVWNGSPR